VRERPIHGKRIVVTGATNGIGTELARALARRGAALTLVARNPAKAEATAAELAGEAGAVGAPDFVLADLSDLTAVREAAAELRERHDVIDVLVNNAGVNHLSGRTTADGFDEMVATNHLGPFLLTNLLLGPLQLAPSARVVVTASEAHRSAFGLDLDRLAEPATYGPVGAERRYGQSKLMNILFTQELARRLEGTGVTANCFCPGLNDTGLVSDSRAVLAASRLGARLGVVRRPEVGARMGVRLVVDADLDGVSGKFFTSTPGAGLLPSTPARRNEKLQRALWERSAELVGL